MRYVKSSLCQVAGLSCMGCCGHGFKGKKEVAEGIEKNTLEYMDHQDRGVGLREWMNRSKELRNSGVCRNLVYDVEKDRILCPLHPEVNNGEDFRVDHHYCDILHVCKTAFFFELWDDKMKNDFIRFIRSKRKKGMSWYEYSMGMNDDSLLAEFEGLKWD